MKEIRIKNQGSMNIIPVIKEGGIVELSGINGIGKTKTATYLEILCNNYEFPDRKNFDFYRSGTDEITIEIDVDGGPLKGILTPNKWKYDTKTKKIVPKTIGSFYLNSKELEYESFKTTLDVKIIRGDESLEKQLENISSFILERLTHEIQGVEDFEESLGKYQRNFVKESHISMLLEYLENESRLDTLSSSIRERDQQSRALSEEVDKLDNLLQLQNDLQYRYNNDQDKIEAFISELNKQISAKDSQIKQLDRVISEFEKNVQTEDKSREIPIEDIRKKNKLENNISKLRVELQELDPKIFAVGEKLDENILNIIEAQNNQIDLTVKELEKINLEDSDILYMGKLIDQLHDISDDAIQRLMGDKIVFSLELDHQEEKHPVNFQELELATSQSLFDHLNSAEVKRIKQQVVEFSKIKEKVTKIKEKALDLKKELDKLAQLEEKINKKFKEKRIDSKIKAYLDQITKAIERKKKIEEERESLIIKKSNEQKILDALKTKKTKDELISGLQISNFPITEFLNDPEKKADLNQAFEDEIDTFSKSKEEKVKEKIFVERQNKNLLNQLGQIKKIYDQQESELKATATHQGFTDFNKWINYTVSHNKNVEFLINKADSLKAILNHLKGNLTIIKDGKSTSRRKGINKIYKETISEIFSEIFLELYDKAIFFKQVFKEFDSMKKFDINNKEIIFLKNGEESGRKLREFSSGEKSFAYIRALMSISESGARFRIVILDESNALLDHIKSDILFNYQKGLIDSGEAFKFLNILPARDKLDEKIAYTTKKIEDGETQLKTELELYLQYKECLTENGYFQKILYP